MGKLILHGMPSPANNREDMQFQNDKEVVDRMYTSVFYRSIDWKNPTTFNEKICIFKISKEAEELWPYVDKYEVRKHIANTIGETYLTPLLGVYESGDDIDFAKLPQSFVLKATHGAGWNIICKEKNTLDWNAVKKSLFEWTHTNYYDQTKEIQYKKIIPRIICEKYLDVPDLKDYKIFCFSGKPRIIEVVKDRFGNLKRFFYDTAWNRLPLTSEDTNEIPEKGQEIEKPQTLQQLLLLSEKLSSPFKHVRVDWYTFGKQVYFGELTFTTANGLYKFNPPEYDKELGHLFPL